jgi:hypothetical protein
VKPLLDPGLLNPVFAPLKGLRVGLVHSRGTGNGGDRLLEAAAEQLLALYGVAYRVVEPDAPGDAEILLCPAGGHYGHPYCPLERDRRASAIASGLPCVLLPVTAYGVEVHARPWRACFARDHVSQRLMYGSALVPDLALCYAPARTGPWHHDGTLRSFSCSPEGLWKGQAPDERWRFSGPAEYVAFVAGHRRVVTDSLHIAVAGLMARRHVTLLPTRLHKNRSVWESWLRDLGCRWADAPPG